MINTEGEIGEITRAEVISAESVREINSKLWRYANEQVQYKTILREPMKPGSLGVNCEELVYYKGAWVSPGDSIGRRMMDRMSK